MDFSLGGPLHPCLLGEQGGQGGGGKRGNSNEEGGFAWHGVKAYLQGEKGGVWAKAENSWNSGGKVKNSRGH